MKNRKGFTLTEILLAIMVVGIIGVALAALTTSATRESGVGRSRVVLRNNLTRMLRQLRYDIQSSSQVLYAKGVITDASGATPLLVLAKNTMFDGRSVGSLPASYVIYCFNAGGDTLTANEAMVLPQGARDGGTITRFESEELPAWQYPGEDSQPGPVCMGGQTILSDVKYIPSSADGNYPVPYFGLVGHNGEYDYFSLPVPDEGTPRQPTIHSQLQVNLIVELPSSPVVNEVVEETFVVPNGFRDPR